MELTRYSFEHIEERLKEMETKKILHEIFMYGKKSEQTKNINDNIYINQVIKLIENELLIRIK